MFQPRDASESGSQQLRWQNRRSIRSRGDTRAWPLRRRQTGPARVHRRKSRRQSHRQEQARRGLQVASFPRGTTILNTLSLGQLVFNRIHGTFGKFVLALKKIMHLYLRGNKILGGSIEYRSFKAIIGSIFFHRREVMNLSAARLYA